MPKLFLSGNPEADELLSNDPLALLCGMVLDQQVPMEKAFAGPHVLTERLGHDLNAAAIAAYDPDRFAALFVGPPAIHRYPAAMAARVQKLCAALVADYGGPAGARRPGRTARREPTPRSPTSPARSHCAPFGSTSGRRRRRPKRSASRHRDRRPR